jgi:two-component system response regulator YesN
MYKLMIADDEIDKLEALRDNYNWANHDVTICCEATDGMEAYELLVKERPDICIIDVKMPIISGIEAMKRAKKEGVTTKFIILSGFDDFSYAQEALSLSTVEYLLKPCKVADIMQAVLKCVNLVDEERRQANLLKKYHLLSEGNLQNLKQQFLINLITGKIKSDIDCNEEIKQFDLGMLAGNYAICIMDFDKDNSLQNKNNDLFFASIIDHAKDKLSQVNENETFVYNNLIVSIVSMKNITESFDAFSEALESFVDLVKLQFDLNCAIGVSDLKISIIAFREAFLEAELTANAAVFSFGQNVTFFAEMNNSNFKYPIKFEKKIINSMGTDENQIMQSVDEFFSSYKLKSIYSKRNIQNMAVTLIYDILKVMVERQLDLDNISEKANRTAQEILSCSNVDSIKDLVIKFMISITQQSTKKNMSTAAKRAVSFISENYSKKICLESVADEIHVSPSYLSMLFKQQTGLNLIEYLNRFRIEKSKDYLNDLNLKIYEVAYKVGFQDEKYYYLLFKRYTGLTATQYRESIINPRTLSEIQQ